MNFVLGIVGGGANKFTSHTESEVKKAIRAEILRTGATAVCSGRSPLGGIDIWAIEVAKSLGFTDEQCIEYPPRVQRWSGAGGYKERNIQIAQRSHAVVCFAVKRLPPDYVIEGYEFFCYHCGTAEHIKSGGCFTAKYARLLGKAGYTIVIE